MPEPYYQDDSCTIYNADCREILPELEGVDLVLTDPPYGDAFDTNYTRFTGGVAVSADSHATIVNDDAPFDPAHLLGFPEIVVFGANRFSSRLPVGSWLVWDKRSPNGHKNVMSDAEVAWWSHGRGIYIYQHAWDGFNRKSERGSALHPTQKPVAVMAWCLSKCRNKGRVLDPYMGSGPTLVAAKNLNRRAIGIEISEEYCQIAAQRLSQEVLPLEVS